MLSKFKSPFVSQCIDVLSCKHLFLMCPYSPSVFNRPEAVCKRVALGGVSVSMVDDGQISDGSGTFHAEQRIGPAHLYTVRTNTDGSTFETLAYMAPEENVMVINVTWTSSNVSEPAKPYPAIAPTKKMNVSTWTWSGGDSASTTSDGILIASRAASPALPTNSTIRAIITTIATRTHASITKPQSKLHLARVSSSNGRSVASGVVELTSGVAISLVVAVSDNLLEGNLHDPSTEAAALARSTSAAQVATDSASWWGKFWSKSSVSLPDSPEVTSTPTR